ncbi:MAG: hypothetical protein MI863_26830 [Desulfobacterales bacterium]|nr:hypothetical protein [Desulfobacterales bacterium]
MAEVNQLPLIFCGPVIRKLIPGEMILWWVSPRPLTGRFEAFFKASGLPVFSCLFGGSNTRVARIADRAWVHLLTVVLPPDLPENIKINYTLIPDQAGRLQEMLPHLAYPGEPGPSFMLKTRLDTIFHGSCRNPHHDSEDSFLGADRVIEGKLDETDRPALLMLTGDQIYADDVAGPMLHAIHQVIRLLGFPDESFEDAVVGDSEALYQSNDTYYRRKSILPNTRVGRKWYTRGGVYPVFTSFFSHNHLISFAEYTAMYLLVWSPVLWQYVDLDAGVVAEEFKTAYKDEQDRIQSFVDALPSVARVFAHMPVYMIFDDHDITDDWNMTAQWEIAAYGHPFSRQIIANGLAAYWLCQGWGNAPEKFGRRFMEGADAFLGNPNGDAREGFTDILFKFESWEYDLPTSPKLVVIDSRTRRWRSEVRAANPSGLLDWEALMELQQLLINESSVILVAPAPVFGVKFIEMIQNIVSFFGYPLAVDAENWMAHKGCAYTLLQIFKHLKTPQNYVILSGDVHYSFAYDIKIRFRTNSPRIWQITSSGIKNEFPRPLLKWLDRFNQWLYGPYSVLNIFTKRRQMKIRERVPKGRENRRLIPDSGMGMVVLDEDGRPVRIQEIYAGRNALEFLPGKVMEEERR